MVVNLCISILTFFQNIERDALNIGILTDWNSYFATGIGLNIGYVTTVINTGTRSAFVLDKRQNCEIGIYHSIKFYYTE